jgi:hypothetical protein
LALEGEKLSSLDRMAGAAYRVVRELTFRAVAGPFRRRLALAVRATGLQFVIAVRVMREDVGRGLSSARKRGRSLSLHIQSSIDRKVPIE